MGGAPRFTLVSGLFDIAKRERNPVRRDGPFYLRTSRWITELDQDLVVFADPDLCEGIERRRQASAARTLVIPLPLEELPTYRLLGEITEALRTNPVLNADPDKDTPLYSAMLWGKVELLARAIELDPFESSHFAWVDYALFGQHDLSDEPFAQPLERMRLLQMRGFTFDEVDEPDYLSAMRGIVSAGCMAGPKASCLRLVSLFREASTTNLAAGLAGNDEQILPLTIAADPDLFEFHFGDYAEILTNWVRPRRSADNLLFQLRHARSEGNSRHSWAVASRILQSVDAGVFEAPPDQLAWILDECFLAAMACSTAGEARGVERRYMELVEQEPAARHIFLRHEPRLRRNFELAR